MERYKYPRTMHLPFSPGTTSDDRILDSIDHFQDMEVIVTEKLDGENTNMYGDLCHARSTSSSYHPSRTLIFGMHGDIAHEIPDNWRICGENMYAKHSIFYDKLTSYLYVFSIWDENNRCLTWDGTKEVAKELGLETVPELYRGPWDKEKIKSCWTGVSNFGPEQEGYVVRNVDSFHYNDFGMNLSLICSQTETGR